MDTPITLEELKEQLRDMLPTATFDLDEESGEIIIWTGLAEDLNGELEEIGEELDSEEIESFSNEPLEEDIEDEN